MKIGASNRFMGTVKSINHGPVSTEVVIRVAKGVEITSVITDSSAHAFGLTKGTKVYAVIKASNALIATD